MTRDDAILKAAEDACWPVDDASGRKRAERLVVLNAVRAALAATAEPVKPEWSPTATEWELVSAARKRAEAQVDALKAELAEANAHIALALETHAALKAQVAEMAGKYDALHSELVKSNSEHWSAVCRAERAEAQVERLRRLIAELLPYCADRLPVGTSVRARDEAGKGQP